MNNVSLSPYWGEAIHDGEKVKNKNTIINNEYLAKSHFSEEFKETKIEKVEKYIQTDIIEEELAKLQEEHDTDKKYFFHCLEDNKQIILEFSKKYFWK